jgi:hypothetical protein
VTRVQIVDIERPTHGFIVASERTNQKARANGRWPIADGDRPPDFQGSELAGGDL